MSAAERSPSEEQQLPRPDPRDVVLRPVAPSPSPAPSRLEELGLMTASVAHDFNNILSVIMVCAGEVAEEAGEGLQADRAREIREAAERGAELSRRLLARDLASEPSAETIAIDVAIVDSLPLLRRTLGERTEITLTSEGHLPRVMLAPGDLERMLVNLAANSRDAMAEGGAVAIQTALVSVPPGDPRLGAGWCVRVSFTDDGSGMSPETAQEAIKPYFSTKTGGGSGLGLATVHGLLRSRGGDLRLNTALGRGTTISLYLPAVRSSGEPLSLQP